MSAVSLGTGRQARRSLCCGSAMQMVLLRFFDELRAAGLPISTSESIDALQAVAAIGLEREILSEALAASLVKDEEDRPLFEDVFSRFFGVPRSRHKNKQAANSGEGIGSRSQTHGDSAHSALHNQLQSQSHPAALLSSSQQDTTKGQKQFFDSLKGKPMGARSSDQDSEDNEDNEDNEAYRAQFAQRKALHKALLNKPFHMFDRREIEASTVLVEELSRRLKAHLSRRYTRRKHGRLDFRRTIRASISHGGVPLSLLLRGRKPGKPDLLALCDVSGSVCVVSDFLLALVSPAASYFRQVRTFAYIDRVCEVSFEAGHVVPHDDMLDLYALSDFGKVLQDFWQTYGELLLTRNTVVLILGDARNNRRPPRPDLLARIRERVKTLVWLNPEPLERWDTGDSVMGKYTPVCDTVLACRNLDELQHALKQNL